LNHGDGETEQFYRDLQQRGIRVLVGMEATGYARWFERLLAELLRGHPKPAIQGRLKTGHKKSPGH
jgi:transposase